jgi:hypothetical protein
MDTYMRLIFTVMALLFLTACDGGLKASDYIGGYVSTTEGCPSRGDLGMNFQKSQVDISFFCFLKECGNMKGKASKEGFFHIDTPEGYFIKGKITALEAKGNWFMNIRGKDCYGHWVGLKN